MVGFKTKASVLRTFRIEKKLFALPLAAKSHDVQVAMIIFRVLRLA